MILFNDEILVLTVDINCSKKWSRCGCDAIGCDAIGCDAIGLGFAFCSAFGTSVKPEMTLDCALDCALGCALGCTLGCALDCALDCALGCALGCALDCILVCIGDFSDVTTRTTCSEGAFIITYSLLI